MKDFVFNLQRFTKTIRLTNSDDDYDNRYSLGFGPWQRTGATTANTLVDDVEVI